MLWATCRHPRANGTATAWLIRRFLDPRGHLLFLAPGAVAEAQSLQGAIGFGAPSTRYPDADHRGRCSFEQLVGDRLSADPALVRLARIVHDAEGAKTKEHPLVRLAALAYQSPPAASPARAKEAPGLWAITDGFGEASNDDADIVARATFLYDALYAHLKRAQP